MRKIAKLKISIALFGITQPLLVSAEQPDGTYRVISGHRRLLAAKELFEEGETELEYIPCYIDDNTDEIREKILLIHTNSTTRKLSDWEKLEQLAQLKELFAEYKKANNIPGRLRQLLAEALDVSPATVGRLEQVHNNLEPDIKQELKEEKINISTAVTIASMPKEEQKEALERHKTKVKKKAVHEREEDPESEPAQMQKQQFNHELKIHTKFFNDLASGNKNFEVQFDDRGYKVGDTVRLNELKKEKYTGRAVSATISYVLNHDHFPEALSAGYVVLALRDIKVLILDLGREEGEHEQIFANNEVSGR